MTIWGSPSTVVCVVHASTRSVPWGSHSMGSYVQPLIMIFLDQVNEFACFALGVKRSKELYAMPEPCVVVGRKMVGQL